jgi:putative ABC transport system permease protein
MSLTAHPLLARSGLRYLLKHRWQAALALIGITLGVAVVLAVDLANGAARQSFAESAAQLRGDATHRLVNPAGQVPETLYTQLFTTPGHPPMAPVISERIRVTGKEGRYRLVGLDLFAEGSFRGTLGQAIEGQPMLTDWLARPGATALSRVAAETLGVSLGDSLEVRHQGRVHTLVVTAIYPADAQSTSDLLIVDIATAQAVTARHDSLSYVDLVLDTGQQEWLVARLPPSVRLVDAREQAEGITRMSAAFELNLTAMSLLALLVGMFLIYNSMTFAIVQRRNLLGRLRALGVTPREIARLIFTEALVLALIGVLLGILLGILLGRGLTGIVAKTISALYYDTGAAAMPVTLFALFKAVLLGLGGTLLATWLPARQAASTPPLTTLSRTALESVTRRRLPQVGVLGIALVAVGLVVALYLPGGVVIGFVGLFLLLVGAAMATPLSLGLVPRSLRGLALPGVVRMAVRDLDRHLSRLATATAALMVALAASVGVAIMVESMRSSVGVWLDSLLSADLYVSADYFEDGAPLPAGAVAMIRDMPQIASFSRYRNRKVDIAGTPTAVIAADLAPRSRAGFRFVAGGARTAWSGFDAGEVLISEPLAHRLGVTAGDALPIPTESGPRSFTVAAVFQDYASERGRVFIALPRYQGLWADTQIDSVALFARNPKSGDLYRAAVDRLSTTHDLSFTAAREIYSESMRIFDRTFRITEVLRYLLLLVALIGVFSALMAIQLERRREYAVLRAIGFTGRQLTGLILFQSGMLGLLAGLLALPTGMAMAWVLTDAIQLRAFGWTMQYLVTPEPLLLSVALGVVAALLAGIYPAWRASRQDPAPQLRQD